MTETPRLEWDGDEPYFSITPDVRLTPARQGDAEAYQALMNSPEVAARNWAYPTPYPLEMAEQTIKKMLDREEGLIRELRNHPEPGYKIHGCPTILLREVATGRVIGLVGTVKLEQYLVPPEPKLRLLSPYTPAPASPSPDNQANGEVKPVEWADESWNFGYLLLLEWAGKGLAQKAGRILIDGWVIPRMGLSHLTAQSEIQNKRSHHILKKLGFHHVYTYPRKGFSGEETETLKFDRRL